MKIFKNPHLYTSIIVGTILCTTIYFRPEFTISKVMIGLICLTEVIGMFTYQYEKPKKLWEKLNDNG